MDPYFKALFAKTFSSVQTTMPLRILDAGSGLGVYSQYFRSLGHDVFSIDASPTAARLSRGSRASILCLPFRDHVFDVVVAAHILEHLTDDEIRTFLHEAARVLKPRGTLIALMPNYRSLTRPFLGENWFPDPTHINIKTTHSFMKLLREERFGSIRWIHGIPMFIESSKPRNGRWLMPYFGLGQRLRNAIWIQDLLFWMMSSTPMALFREVMFVTSHPPR